MKPVLIQTLHRHNQKKNITKPDFRDVDPVHGGHKDRSGFMVFLILMFALVVAVIMN